MRPKRVLTEGGVGLFEGHGSGPACHLSVIRVSNLDARTEGGTPVHAERNPEAVVLDEDRKPQPVLSIRHTIRIDELAERQGEALRELWSSVQARQLSAIGPPIVRYQTLGNGDRCRGRHTGRRWPSPVPRVTMVTR